MRPYIALFLASLLLAGCISLGSNSQQEQPAVNISQEQQQQEGESFVSVSFEGVPSKVVSGEPINILWTVSTGEKKQIRTGLVYGPESIAFPSVPSDYQFMVEERMGTSPSNFLETISFDSPGTFYLRSYAIVDGKIYWSEERAIEVVGPEMEEDANVRVYSLEIGPDGRLNQTSITETINSNLKLWFKSSYNKRVVVETPSLGEVQPLVLDPSETGYISFKALSTIVVIVKDNDGNKLDEARVIVAGE